MKVKELLPFLEKANPEAEVYISRPAFVYVHLGGVQYMKEKEETLYELTDNENGADVVLLVE